VTGHLSHRHLVIRGLRVAPVASPETRSSRGSTSTVGKGEVHAIMGPNGSGKTTLAYALMGHPAYVVTGGEVTWQGRDILKLSPDKRARLGMFLAFQYPRPSPASASRRSSGARSTRSSRASTRAATSTRPTR
jgi:Fe-S cluster assembly ATP-binding protein